MIDKSKCLQIGKVTKTHGVGGEVAILLNQGVLVDNIEAGFLFLDLDGGLVPFKIDTLRDRSESIILVKFEMFQDEKQVQKYKDCAVWMLQADVVQDEENPGIGLLIGFTVIDQVHGEIGVISDLRDMERNPLFVIDGKNGEILIPIADEFISHIDEPHKQIYLNTPDGLLELYL